MLFCLKLDFPCFFFSLFDLTTTQDDKRLLLLAASTARKANRYFKLLFDFAGSVTCGFDVCLTYHVCPLCFVTCGYMFMLQTMETFIAITQILLVFVILGSEVLFTTGEIGGRNNNG